MVQSKKTDRVFVDTNVLVYSRDSSHGTNQRIAERWMETLWDEGRGRTTIQVCMEYAFHFHNRYSLSGWDALVVSAARLRGTLRPAR